MLFVAPYARLVRFKVYLATERSLVFVEREKEKKCLQSISHFPVLPGRTNKKIYFLKLLHRPAFGRCIHHTLVF